jgi:hypothetical protein
VSHPSVPDPAMDGVLGGLESTNRERAPEPGVGRGSVGPQARQRWFGLI